MKNITPVLFAFLAILSIYACSSETTTEADELNTRSVSRVEQTVENEEGEEDLSFSYITRKWALGKEYIDLAQDGTFEANLYGKHLKGRWGLSFGTDAKKTLKLIGKNADATDKVNDFNETYELINLSYDRLVAVDSEGNEINFFAEKK